VWLLRLKFNNRFSNQTHEMIVSYGPLVHTDLVVQPPVGPFLCGGYTDVLVRVKHPEGGRVMSGAEAFSVRVVSPSAMSMSVPLELEPGATTAIATVCWPEVGEHSVSVTLDGALLPKCPIAVTVLPEDICLAACQIQGAGTNRAVAGERRYGLDPFPNPAYAIAHTRPAKGRSLPPRIVRPYYVTHITKD
jgi:filamin